LQIAEGVLVCVPAAQVDLHHADAGLDQPACDEESLAPLLAAVLGADALRLVCQVERIVLAGARGVEQLQSALAMGVPGVEPAGTRGVIDVAPPLLEAAEQRRAIAELRQRQVIDVAEVGQAEIGIAAARVVPPGAWAGTGGALGIVRIVVAEAVGARAGWVW